MFGSAPAAVTPLSSTVAADDGGEKLVVAVRELAIDTSEAADDSVELLGSSFASTSPSILLTPPPEENGDLPSFPILLLESQCPPPSVSVSGRSIAGSIHEVVTIEAEKQPALTPPPTNVNVLANLPPIQNTSASEHPHNVDDEESDFLDITSLSRKIRKTWMLPARDGSVAVRGHDGVNELVEEQLQLAKGSGFGAWKDYDDEETDGGGPSSPNVHGTKVNFPTVDENECMEEAFDTFAESSSFAFGKGKESAHSIRTTSTKTLRRGLRLSSISSVLSNTTVSDGDGGDPEMIALAKELLEMHYWEAVAGRSATVKSKKSLKGNSTVRSEKGVEDGLQEELENSTLWEDALAEEALVEAEPTSFDCPICGDEVSADLGYEYHDGCENGHTCRTCALAYVRSCLGDVQAQFPIKCPLCFGSGTGGGESGEWPLTNVVKATTELAAGNFDDGEGLSADEVDGIWRHTNLKDLLVEQGHWFCPKCERLSLREGTGENAEEMVGGAEAAAPAPAQPTGFMQRMRGIFLPTRRSIRRSSNTSNPFAPFIPSFEDRVECPYCYYIHCDACDSPWHSAILEKEEEMQLRIVLLGQLWVSKVSGM
ncbi:hypothetical protein HK097_010291 [Rhizophlyctis rosea]|uniref:RING-type domain-containing protein n=1 Tax=Rhizophlyctis rosea TaxID=64517 RepID=A0AAD5X8V9_9FUNG|nr:hypothetical protein HK097_010291 [Rhizophlyctis rosea]